MEDVLQLIVDLLFGKMIVYLSPVIALFTVLMFSGRLIEVLYDSVGNRRRFR